MNPNDSGASAFDDYNDLDRYGKTAAPQHQFALGVESLTDGAYDCEVTSATLDRIDEHRVLRLGLRLLKEGRAIEQIHWLNRQESVNAFLAEMAVLGFPSGTWGEGPGKTPLSRAIPQCVQQLRGLKFRAAKTSRHVEAQAANMGKAAREAKTYHDLRIQSRITGTAQPGATPQPTQAAPTPAPTQAAHDPNDIPF